MAQMIKQYPGQRLGDEKGLVLVVSLMMVAVILLLGTTAVLTTSTDMKISANYKTGNEAFYAAEAGIEEARARLVATAANPITDGFPTNAGWRAYIGPLLKANGKGYNSGDSMHARVASIYTSTPPLDYTVRIVHATNAGGNILYWGDANNDGLNERNALAVGRNIYRVTSYGAAANGATKALEVEMAPLPPINLPGSLYVQSPLNIIGNARILGVDQCGGANLPGVTTTLTADTVSVSNNALVTGTGSLNGTPPSVLPNAPVLNVPAMIDSWKGSANYQYNAVSATQTGMTWGDPTEGATLENPSTCNQNNIVYYNTRAADGTLTDLKLTNTQGCGILMVDGDLDVNGGFSWYGVVLVRGTVKYTGGGGKNITGGVIASESIMNLTDPAVVGGGTNIVYCSSAINNLTQGRPLRRLSWREKEDNL
jgi:Tfp pilus assembly protein PilX